MLSRIFIVINVVGLLYSKDLIAVDHSGKWLLSSHDKGEIILWDIEKGRLNNTFTIDCKQITNIDLFSDYNDNLSVHIIVSCKDSTIIFIDKDGTVIKNDYPPYVGAPLKISADVMSLSLGSQYLYCFGNDEIGYIVDPMSRKFVSYIQGSLEIDPIISKLSQDNKYLLVGYSDGRLCVWDVDRDIVSNDPNIIQISRSIINDISLSNAGTAVIVDQMNHLYLYSFEYNNILKKKKFITNGSSQAVLIKNNGTGMITGHHNGRMNYWQIKEFRIKLVDQSPSDIHSGKISELVFLPNPGNLNDQTIIISAGADKYIRFTNVNDYSNVGTIYKDDLGWVVYNKNGGYAGTRSIPESFNNTQKIASPFENLF